MNKNKIIETYNLMCKSVPTETKCAGSKVLLGTYVFDISIFRT